jgi:hypothetical protein
MDREFFQPCDIYRLNQILCALNEHGRTTADSEPPHFVLTVERREHGYTVYMDSKLALEIDKRVTTYQICRYEWTQVEPNRVSWLGCIHTLRASQMERSIKTMIDALDGVLVDIQNTK